ncbi:MAG TPA: ACP S-malonyltransferase [Steroidobacteraceae bacterium]|nr:ACP S-malonyltransferase [Steroidobacteraceae bacterium]
MSSVFVFPGQGSQSVGMLAGFATEPVVRQTFDEASGALGYDLWRLSQEGPEDRLNATEFTQPVMLTAGVALWRLWRERDGIAPTRVAGHSLGEFTALVAASALTLPAAAQLVRTRGRLMQAAVPEGQGAMAAILGLTDAEVEAACREAAQGAVVEAVNFNAPGQVVIAGMRAAVERAITAARARGAKRAVALPVSVPAHSSLLQAAAGEFGAHLGHIALSTPQIRYVSAVDAREHAEPQELRELLTRQLASPVRWQDAVRVLVPDAAQIIECGPGKVLCGMNRRIDKRPDLACLTLEDPASFEGALAATRARAA